MVREDIEAKLREIFGIAKVTFAEPGSFEQEVLFVEVERCREHPSKGVTSGRVTGSIVLFTQAEKAPLGWFARRINKASAASKKGFFFFEVDTEVLASQSRLQNIGERRCRFQYLYEEKYDPARGDLAGVSLEQISFIDVGDGRIQQDGSGGNIGVTP